ncbi:unnamed protein product [Calicophoron daubneyi]|uniref:Secreted protein n=1 Tax=Calicophoron daubneyi TaxID=300641 RepID=A0AAV2TD49_CALDB
MHSTLALYLLTAILSAFVQSSRAVPTRSILPSFESFQTNILYADQVDRFLDICAERLQSNLGKKYAEIVNMVDKSVLLQSCILEEIQKHQRGSA